MGLVFSQYQTILEVGREGEPYEITSEVSQSSAGVVLMRGTFHLMVRHTSRLIDPGKCRSDVRVDLSDFFALCPDGMPLHPHHGRAR